MPNFVLTSAKTLVMIVKRLFTITTRIITMPSHILYKEDVARDIVSFWNSNDQAEIKAIAENLSIRKFKKNEIIYHERQKPTRMLYLVSGKIKIVKEGGVGRTPIVNAIKEKHFFGFRAFFADECYATSAMAFEDCTVASVPIATAALLIANNNNITNFFAKQLAQLLGNSGDRIVSLTQKHIRGRLADTILILKDNYGTMADEKTINISMSRDDLASMSNMSTSNAIRTLSAFAQEGLVEIVGKRIKVLDGEKLEKISEKG